MAAHTTRTPGEPAPMETVRVSIPSLTDESRALDLTNAIIPISGVARIETDIASHTLTVEYDADFLHEDRLRAMIEQSGYPLGDPLGGPAGGADGRS